MANECLSIPNLSGSRLVGEVHHRVTIFTGLNSPSATQSKQSIAGHKRNIKPPSHSDCYAIPLTTLAEMTSLGVEQDQGLNIALL